MIKEKETRIIQHYFELDRYEEAVPSIEKLFTNDPLDPDAFYYMAVVHFSKCDYESARKMCEQALYNGFDSVPCYYLIGQAYEEEGNFQGAEEAYLSALELEPENGDILASYGYLMVKVGFEDKALQLLEEARRVAPSSERVNQLILQYYFAKSDQNQQLLYIQNVMESASSEIVVLVNLGFFHALKNEDKAAMEYFRQAFLQDPTNTDLLKILEEYNQLTHPLFFPQRVIKKAGGPAIIYTLFMVIAILLFFLKQYLVLLPFAAIYIVLCIYTWITPFFYKRFLNGKI
ncbi:tetratricopeptide repeat protein [Neobacillus drentensis]|uniref:tetratricopeptide repeat protein n=1 Tax=Neobacillus drentensis TaxID=220684 RepID=UPI003000B17F